MPTDPWAAFPVVSGGGGADPWAAFPVVAAAPAPQEPQDDSLSGRWAAAAPRREGAANVALGAAKGLGSTIYGLGRLFNENTPIGSMTGGYPAKPDELTPEGTAQNVGYGAEQIGEFFVPGAATGNLARAANLGWKGRAALEAASAGSVAAAQTGGNARATATAAALGASGPLTARLGEVAAPGLRRLAETQYGRALNATTNRLKDTSKRIVPELLNRHVTGSSLDTLAARGAEGSTAAGRALNQSYAAASDAGVQSQTAPIIKSLEKVKQRFFATSNSGVPIAVNPGAIAKVEAIQKLVGEFGDTARPDQLWAMRKNIDDIIEATGGFSGPVTPGTTRTLQREARTAMQKELNKASPDIEKLNAEFLLWKGLEDVSRATIKRKEGQSGIVELGIRSGVGGSLGLLMGGGDREWGTAGALLGAVTKHPRYRTVAASEKARLAHALAVGRADTATSILSKILAGLVTASDSSATSRP